jgi:hypothetical protein
MVVSDESDRICKEAVMVCFNVTSLLFLEELKKTLLGLSSAGHKSNPERSEYELR